MRKPTALLVLFFFSGLASAHEDTIFSIAPDGAIAGLPERYGPASLKVSHTSAGAISGISLTTPSSTTKLHPCVLRHLSGTTKINAFGSWYHDLEDHPPYITLGFYSTPPSLANPFGEGYKVTFSLLDGQILSAQRATDPWWGQPRILAIVGASECQAWQDLP